MMTSLYQIGGAITGSVGSTVGGAVWNQTIPKEIEKSGFNASEITKIMGSITYAQSLPDDGTYQAVQYAYGEAQKILSIVAVRASFVCFLFTLGMKSFSLDDRDAEHQLQDNDKNAAPEEVITKVDTSTTKNSGMEEKIAADNDQQISSPQNEKH